MPKIMGSVPVSSPHPQPSEICLREGVWGQLTLKCLLRGEMQRNEYEEAVILWTLSERGEGNFYLLLSSCAFLFQVGCSSLARDELYNIGQTREIIFRAPHVRIFLFFVRLLLWGLYMSVVSNSVTLRPNPDMSHMHTAWRRKKNLCIAREL